MQRNFKLILMVIIVAIAIMLIVATDIKTFGETATPSQADCIIVLGCSVYGNEPSPFLKGRLQGAEKLYKEGYAKYIVVSGGQGDGESISEAEAMKNYLVKRGIDREKIIMEDNSTSTYENLKYSKYEMERQGFSSAIVVSNKFHLRRAAYIADKMKMDTSFFGVYMKEHKKSELKGFLREIAAIIITALKFFLRKLCQYPVKMSP